MKDYYYVLGVSRHATSSEIKIAYRKLAILYHPDRNSSELASEKIKEVNEAYHTLGDKVKRWAYDQKNFRPIPQAEGMVIHTAKRKNPFSQQSNQVNPQSKKSDRQKIFETMHRYLFLSYRISFVSFLFCLFLAVDYFLPFEETTQKIVGKYSYFVSPAASSQQMEIIETSQQDRFKLYTYEAEDFEVGEDARITASRLAKVPIGIQGRSTVHVSFTETIYANFLFVPLLLFIASALGLFFRHSIEFRFNLMIVNSFFLIVSILMLFSHNIFM